MVKKDGMIFKKTPFWLKGDGGNRKSLLFKEQD